MATQSNVPAVTPDVSQDQFSGLHLAHTADTARNPRSFTLVTLLAIALDYVSVSFGIVAGLLVYHLIRHTHVSNEAFKLAVFSIQYALAFVLFGRIHSLYSQSASLLYIRETAGILRVSVFSLALLSFGILLSQTVVPRLLLLLSWVFITFFVLIQKHTTRKLLARLSGKAAAEKRVLILGSGPDARRLFSFMSNSPDLHLRPVGFFEDASAEGNRVIYSHGYSFREHAPVYGGQLDGSLLDRLGVTDIYVASSELAPGRMSEIASIANDRSIQLSFVGSVQPHLPNRLTSVKEMDGLIVSSLSGVEASRITSYEYLKRAVELVFAVALIIATLPLWVCVALWVRFTSEGPIFFQQERIGRGGKPFPLFKFRSMYVTAPKYGRSPEDSHDPRITPAGRFLRKTSLDELPQLLNVLRGDMALVGPRPEMPYVVAQYTPQQAHRLSVIPGITGLWQLSADRKFAIHESIEYDLYYIEHRGFFLDMAILLHTAAFAMKGI